VTRHVTVAVALLLGLGVLSPAPALAGPAPARTSTVTVLAAPGSTAPHAANEPWVPLRPLPKHSGTGRRIVYSEGTPQHVWLVDAACVVVRDFAASGRRDWPRVGHYRVFSKSSRSWSSRYGVSFRWMVRFTIGHSAAIGFHTIPRYSSGKRMHPVSKLGKPVGRGGCPHTADPDAKFLYDWARIGTSVVVLRRASGS
jgi:lipoprotein-anchoring transpeptidase ErfK/SrfK